MNPIDEHEIYRQVNADDLAEFGLLPEFIGRLPVVCTLGELTVDDLKDVLTKPTNALLKQYQKLFSVDGVTLTFTRRPPSKPSPAPHWSGEWVPEGFVRSSNRFSRRRCSNCRTWTM